MSDAVRLPFFDRSEAGRLLAQRVAALQAVDPVVFALPRGGVPVALEVASSLGAPLELILVRKIGVPYQPELAVAAVVDGGEAQIVVEPQVLAATGITREAIDAWARIELREIERRRQSYLAGREQVPVAGRTAIVVDDGIATGTTMRAALKALARRAPARLILAVPVAPPETLESLRAEVDEVVCLATPVEFGAIGRFYRDFHQLSDAEVIAALDRNASGRGTIGRAD